ncbi:MAG: hypothetical protein Q8O14_07670 [bacterium]|nr:hypothetical protein [bacterium]
MRVDAIDRWPGGAQPLFFATPEAWEILHLLDRRGLSMNEKLQRLAPYSMRDIRGAYFLTRERGALQRRETLVFGEDRGRADRISARNALRRAFCQAQAMEEAAQLEREAESILEQVRASPPAKVGHRIKSARQVLALASSLQPLPVRLQLLMEVRVEDLAAGIARLQALTPGRFIHARWPTPHERHMTTRALELAIGLLAERDR